MNFRQYLESHYVEACKLQRSIFRDPLMVSMLRNSPHDRVLVASWMRGYSLFQGITNTKREAIVSSFLQFVMSHELILGDLNDDQIKGLYSDLFTVLYKTVPRSWMSATSKLLWCLYPSTVVIYDAFVHRTIAVMQCLDDDLTGFPRIGEPPSIGSEDGIETAVRHYMNFQGMVRKLQNKHTPLLKVLRAKYKESYPYDVRIIDKLLWMIGNLREGY